MLNSTINFKITFFVSCLSRFTCLLTNPLEIPIFVSISADRAIVSSQKNSLKILPENLHSFQDHILGIVFSGH